MISVKNNEYQYSLSDHLGSGSFASVFKCTRTTDKKPFALKIVDKVKLNQAGEYLYEALRREIATQTIATQSGIPFFVFLIENFEDEKNIYIILELCEKSLLHFLNNKKLAEQTSLELCFQIAIGLDYLHSVQICHRDIKPENILIKDGYLKIADFGFATTSLSLTTHLGTKPYMSPEFFQNDVEEFTPKIDVWALNTCLYLFLTGKFYFFSHIPMEMERQILNKQFVIDSSLSHISKDTVDLIKRGYEKDPNKRLSMHEYLNHPAFNCFHQKYSKYLLQEHQLDSKSKQIIQDLDDLKLSSIEGDNQVYLRYFLNYRNNSLTYSKLAVFFEEYGVNLIFTFLLIKKHLQNLAALLICLKKQQVPKFSYFKTIEISSSEWAKFCKGPWYRRITSLITRDMKSVSDKCTQAYKNLLNTNATPEVLPKFDLNVTYNDELIAFCDDFRQKCQNIGGEIDKPEVSKALNWVQKILIYEKYDCGQIILF
jgi:serine/threonine protein kinase